MCNAKRNKLAITSILDLMQKINPNINVEEEFRECMVNRQTMEINRREYMKGWKDPDKVKVELYEDDEEEVVEKPKKKKVVRRKKKVEEKPVEEVEEKKQEVREEVEEMEEESWEDEV